MYQDPGKRPPWWLETLVLTRVVMGILIWPFIALIAGVAAIVGLLFAFVTHWALGLLVVAIIAAVIVLFGWWDRRRPPRALP